MKTVDQFYEDHLNDLFNILYHRIDIIENKGYMDDQDEMELEALDSLVSDLESI